MNRRAFLSRAIGAAVAATPLAKLLPDLLAPAAKPTGVYALMMDFTPIATPIDTLLRRRYEFPNGTWDLVEWPGVTFETGLTLGEPRYAYMKGGDPNEQTVQGRSETQVTTIL